MAIEANLRLRRVYAPSVDERVSFEVNFISEYMIETFLNVLQDAGVLQPELREWTKVELNTGFLVCKRGNILDLFNYLAKVYRNYSLAIGLYDKITVQLSYTDSVQYDFIKKEFVFKGKNKEQLFEKNNVSQEAIKEYVDAIVEELSIFKLSR